MIGTNENNSFLIQSKKLSFVWEDTLKYGHSSANTHNNTEIIT